MLSKIRLDQTKKFEIALATKKISEMLIAYINGHDHYLAIGAEKGDIQKWDDFVIEKSDGSYEQIQVKRQLTDFSNEPCTRNKITQGVNAGKWKNLSPLDESIACLADWSDANDPQTAKPKRRFVIEVPDLTVNVKEDFQLRVLHEFIHTHIRPTTTVDTLQPLASTPIGQKVFQWLNSWCRFKNWEHILKALKVLEIRHSGAEIDLNNHTEGILSASFQECRDVRLKVQSYIDENSTYANSITARPLFDELQRNLLPDVITWTQYHNHQNEVLISGTHDSPTIEYPQKVVPAFWDNQQRRSSLKFSAPINTHNSRLSLAILRMALHFQGQSTAFLNRSSEWRLIAKNHVGSTLGISDSDFDNLNIIESTTISETSNCRKLELLTQQEEEANRLDQEMYNITWKKVCGILDSTIAQMPASTIRSAIELRWRSWKEPLSNNENEQKALCLSMLHPNAEGKGIRAELRVGPKTAKLIANGLFLLLTVSVGMNPTDNGWKEFGAMLPVQTRAISHWSGPEGSARIPRKLTDDDMSYLLGKEPAKILLLSNVDESPSNIYEETLASSKERTNTLTDQHLPLLLITNSIKLRGIINRGDISELSKYLQIELDKGS